MTQGNNKALTYLNLAKKAGRVRAGVNAIAALRGGELLILCSSASIYTVKDAEKLAERFHCPLIVSEIPVEWLSDKENCKLLCVTDYNLAQAILNNLDGNFTLKSEA